MDRPISSSRMPQESTGGAEEPTAPATLPEALEDPYAEPWGGEATGPMDHWITPVWPLTDELPF
jgi:hypothetical protein